LAPHGSKPSPWSLLRSPEADSGNIAHGDGFEPWGTYLTIFVLFLFFSSFAISHVGSAFGVGTICRPACRAFTFVNSAPKNTMRPE